MRKIFLGCTTFLVQLDHILNTRSYVSIVMTTLYPFCNAYLKVDQQGVPNKLTGE